MSKFNEPKWLANAAREKRAYLLESNISTVFTEALTAEVQAVFANKTDTVSASATRMVSAVLKGNRLHTIHGSPFHIDGDENTRH